MKEKYLIVGNFTATGEEWVAVANNRNELDFELDKIYRNIDSCGVPQRIYVKGRIPDFLFNEFGPDFWSKIRHMEEYKG